MHRKSMAGLVLVVSGLATQSAVAQEQDTHFAGRIEAAGNFADGFATLVSFVADVSIQRQINMRLDKMSDVIMPILDRGEGALVSVEFVMPCGGEFDFQKILQSVYVYSQGATPHHAVTRKDLPRNHLLEGIPDAYCRDPSSGYFIWFAKIDGAYTYQVLSHIESRVLLAEERESLGAD